MCYIIMINLVTSTSSAATERRGAEDQIFILILHTIIEFVECLLLPGYLYFSSLLSSTPALSAQLRFQIFN